MLQVYDPDRWMPQEMSRLVTESEFGLGAVTYQGPNGLIVRPPGLFDNPGAVAGPGMYAALLGLVFVTSASALWKRALALAASFAGVAAIYLSQVRVSLVVLAIMLGTYAGLLLFQQRKQRAFVFGASGRRRWSSRRSRLRSAWAARASPSVRSRSSRRIRSACTPPRAAASSCTRSTTLLNSYPLGAGLGRWGMIAGYFGGGSEQPLWAEIQVAGWAIDGGIPLVLLSVGALVVTLLAERRLASPIRTRKCARAPRSSWRRTSGTAALIFSFTPFVTQIGLQFWFLAGAVQGIATRDGPAVRARR